MHRSEKASKYATETGMELLFRRASCTRYNTVEWRLLGCRTRCLPVRINRGALRIRKESFSTTFTWPEPVYWFSALAREGAERLASDCGPARDGDRNEEALVECCASA